MRKMIVRYRLKADRVDEHLALVSAVFEELARTRPCDVRYAALRAKDGVSFPHIASVHSRTSRIWFSVSVPILSTQSTLAAPSASMTAPHQHAMGRQSPGA